MQLRTKAPPPPKILNGERVALSLCRTSLDAPGHIAFRERHRSTLVAVKKYGLKGKNPDGTMNKSSFYWV